MIASERQRRSDDAPFRFWKGGHLDPSQVHRIVKAAAARAGLSDEVSAHSLRHAHASHSLDRGAPIHLVQATLGHASVATTGRYLHARPTDSSARYLGVRGQTRGRSLRDTAAELCSDSRAVPYHEGVSAICLPTSTTQPRHPQALRRRSASRACPRALSPIRSWCEGLGSCVWGASHPRAYASISREGRSA
jgi:hypothetical protein